MNNLLERPIGIDILEQAVTYHPDVPQYPVHPIHENPSLLVDSLSALTQEEAFTLRGLVRTAAIELHARAIEQSDELAVAGIARTTVEIPRAVVIPKLVTQEVMSALGIQRALRGLQLIEHQSDRSKMLITTIK